MQPLGLANHSPVGATRGAKGPPAHVSDANQVGANSGRVWRYALVIKMRETGFTAYVPDLPGCAAVGATQEQVLRHLQEAIHMHIDNLRATGEPLPRPASTIGFIDVMS